MDNQPKRRTREHRIGRNLNIQTVSDVFDGVECDTKVTFDGCVWIAGDEQEAFKEALQKLYDEFRI